MKKVKQFYIFSPLWIIIMQQVYVFPVNKFNEVNNNVF